jgi:Flp pilus assembly pilin Flp|tara:strand:+ start:271 stop:414 length:144 start_codon:yes stop_codon:yes gene_type:complete
MIKYSSLYIDPGAFQALFVMIIGSLVGLGVALKTYWYRIKAALSRKE